MGAFSMSMIACALASHAPVGPSGGAQLWTGGQAGAAARRRARGKRKALVALAGTAAGGDTDSDEGDAEVEASQTSRSTGCADLSPHCALPQPESLRRPRPPINTKNHLLPHQHGRFLQLGPPFVARGKNHDERSTNGSSIVVRVTEFVQRAVGI